MSLPELPDPDRTMWQHGKQIDHYTADQMRAYALQAVERETTARREAQEQLYAERERHTAEVKKLQAEIGRLQALRREPMTEEDMLACMAAATHEVPARIPPGWRKVMRAVEAHHHITQKEQGK